MSNRWFVIVNPSAGRGHEVRDRATSAIERLGIEAKIVESESADHVVNLARQAATSGFVDFAAVGGDGTAHLVLNGLMTSDMEARPTLAILPTGSGSDFIRTFGLPSDIEGSVTHLASNDRYPTDVGKISGEFGERYFLNAANIGVTAASVRMANRLPDWLGGFRYTAGFWLELPRFGKDDVTVDVDHHRYEQQLLTVVIANGQFFGGGLNIAPRATVQDGLFDVQCFSGPRRNAFSVMPRVIRGAHLTHKAVRRYIGSTVRVEVPEDWPVEADGELIGSGSVEASVVPHGIDFKI